MALATPERAVRVAVLGCGNVGSALIGMLQDRADALAVQSGARLVVGGIAVSDLTRPRGAHVPAELLTTDRRQIWWSIRRSTWWWSSSGALTPPTAW